MSIAGAAISALAAGVLSGAKAWLLLAIRAVLVLLSLLLRGLLRPGTMPMMFVNVIGAAPKRLR